jgi:hypothetical protein
MPQHARAEDEDRQGLVLVQAGPLIQKETGKGTNFGGALDIKVDSTNFNPNDSERADRVGYYLDIGGGGTKAGGMGKVRGAIVTPGGPFHSILEGTLLNINSQIREMYGLGFGVRLDHPRSFGYGHTDFMAKGAGISGNMLATDIVEFSGASGALSLSTSQLIKDIAMIELAGELGCVWGNDDYSSKYRGVGSCNEKFRSARFLAGVRIPKLNGLYAGFLAGIQDAQMKLTSIQPDGSNGPTQEIGSTAYSGMFAIGYLGTGKTTK